MVSVGLMLLPVPSFVRSTGRDAGTERMFSIFNYEHHESTGPYVTTLYVCSWGHEECIFGLNVLHITACIFHFRQITHSFRVLLSTTIKATGRLFLCTSFLTSSADHCRTHIRIRVLCFSASLNFYGSFSSTLKCCLRLRGKGAASHAANDELK